MSPFTMPTNPRPSVADSIMQLVAYGVARVTNSFRSGRHVTICVEIDSQAEKLQQAIEEHSAFVDAKFDGKAIDLGAFQKLREWLCIQDNAVRIAAGLREIPIRHLLPDEELDIDVELAELTAAFEAWTKWRAEVMGRMRRGERELPDDVRAASNASFERYDFANQRVDAILYGLRAPKRYTSKTAEMYRF